MSTANYNGLSHIIEVNYACAHVAIKAIHRMTPSICTFDTEFQQLLSFGTGALSEMMACIRALPDGGNVGSPYVAACIDDLVNDYCRLLENPRVAVCLDFKSNNYRWRMMVNSMLK